MGSQMVYAQYVLSISSGAPDTDAVSLNDLSHIILTFTSTDQTNGGDREAEPASRPLHSTPIARNLLSQLSPHIRTLLETLDEDQDTINFTGASFEFEAYHEIAIWILRFSRGEGYHYGGSAGWGGQTHKLNHASANLPHLSYTTTALILKAAMLLQIHDIVDEMHLRLKVASQQPMKEAEVSRLIRCLPMDHCAVKFLVDDIVLQASSAQAMVDVATLKVLETLCKGQILELQLMVVEGLIRMGMTDFTSNQLGLAMRAGAEPVIFLEGSPCLAVAEGTSVRRTLDTHGGSQMHFVRSRSAGNGGCTLM